MSNFRKIVNSFVVAFPSAQVVGEPMRQALISLQGSEPIFSILRRIRGPEGSVVIDAGANVGRTVVAMRKFDPVSPIVAFEPNAVNFEKLCSRVSRLPGVTLHQCGLFDSDSTFSLYTPGYKNRFYGGLSSLERAEAAEWLPRFAGLYLDPERVQIREESVRVQTLDSFALAPRFVKIDVQGVAVKLLRGAEQTISTHRPVMLIERGRDDGVAGYLSKFGYREYAPSAGGLLPYGGEKDALFVPGVGPTVLEN